MFFDEKESDEASCAVICIKCDKLFDQKSDETLCAKTWIECEKLLSTKRNFSRHYLLYHEGRMQLKVILAFPCIVNRD